MREESGRTHAGHPCAFWTQAQTWPNGLLREPLLRWLAGNGTPLKSNASVLFALVHTCDETFSKVAPRSRNRKCRLNRLPEMQSAFGEKGASSFFRIRASCHDGGLAGAEPNRAVSPPGVCHGASVARPPCYFSLPTTSASNRLIALIMITASSGCSSST